MIYELLFVKLKFVADEFQKDTKVGAFATIIRNVVQIGSSQVNTVSHSGAFKYWARCS